MDIGAIAKKTGTQIIETHISWLLIGEFVYKVKKPLRFSFLDFSTPEKRRFYCAEEVRLNSRLSPDVYLGVVGVDEGGFCPPEGAPEHAVKMRRLDEGRKMDRLLKEDKIGEEQIKNLAKIIAEFHKNAEIARGDFNSPKMIGSQIADLGNFREAIDKAAGLGRWVDNLLKRSSDFIKSNRRLIEGRQGEFVRDCHGDLHSQNVFFQDGIKIIDCIEFSEEFRCIDVASDVAFMAMDLEYAGREDLSKAFVSEYQARSGDSGLEPLLPFYKCYRANVRAKIAAIEWMQKGSADSRTRIDRYVMLAEKYSKTMA